MESETKRLFILVFLFAYYLTHCESQFATREEDSVSVSNVPTTQQAIRNIQAGLLQKLQTDSHKVSVAFCPQKDDGTSTVVKVSLDLNKMSLHPMPERRRNKCVFDAVLRQNWNDPNLQWNNSNIPHIEVLELAANGSPNDFMIWTPNIDIFGELSGKTTSNKCSSRPEKVATWIYPNGDVTRSIRDIWEVETSSSPTGNTLCSFTLESIDCSETSVTLKWDENENEPVRLKVDSLEKSEAPFYTSDVRRWKIVNSVSIIHRILIENVRMENVSFSLCNFGRNKTLSGLYFEIEASWV